MDTRKLNRNLSLPLVNSLFEEKKSAKLNPAQLHIQPNRSRSKWSMITQTKPEADLFLTDDKRTIAAFHELQNLAEATLVGNDGLTALHNFRGSAYFLELKNKLERNEKLVMSEYMYYALTTDDVSKLDLKLLETLTMHQDQHGLMDNIKILIAAHKWAAADESEKDSLNEALRRALTHRGFHNKIGHNRCTQYLNLSGINLAGSKLQFVSLDYTDLTNANLSETDLHHAHICFSCLNKANFSKASCKSTGIPLPQSQTRIESTIALNACFDDVVFDYINLKDSDFTGSSFKRAHISISVTDEINRQTIFDFVTFKNAVITFLPQLPGHPTIKYRLRNTTLINTELNGAVCNDLDVSGARFLDNRAYLDVENFNKELNTAYARLIEPILKQEDTKAQEPKVNKIKSMQKLLAACMLYQMDHLHLTDQEKDTFIAEALKHNVFAKNLGAASYFPKAMGSIFSTVSSTLFSSSSNDDSAYAMLATVKKELTGKTLISLAQASTNLEADSRVIYHH